MIVRPEDQAPFRALPNEATTAFLTGRVLDSSPAIQAFLEGLTSQEKIRFAEIAHHLLHVGFDEGMNRRHIEPTDEAMGRQVVNEAILFAQGAGALSQEIKNLGDA